MSAKPRAGGKTPTASKNVATFPENAAVQLISIAHIVLKATEVKHAIDQARKMKPNEGAVLKAATNWYKASEKVNGSRSTLINSWNNLGTYWGGHAYDTFSNYMQSDVISTCESNEATLFDIGNALVDLYNTVATEYVAAIRNIGETLTSANPLKHKAQEDSNSPEWSDLYDMMAEFVASIINLRADLIEATAARSSAMTQLSGQVMQLRSPGTFPSGASDKNQWKPN